MSVIDIDNVTKPLFVAELSKVKERNLTFQDLDDILRVVFPSKTVRKYWEQIHFQPKPADMALILYYNEDIPLCEKIALMRALLNYVDETTKVRIQKYLDGIKEELQEFQKEYDDTVFDIQVEYTWEEQDFKQEYDYQSQVVVKDFQSAIFMMNKLANDHMRSHKFFKIVKRKVVSQTEFSVINPDVGRATVYEKVGFMRISVDGYVELLDNNWSNDLNDDSVYIGSFGVDDSELFPNEKYISLPFPFHRGDIVRDVVNKCYSVVVTAPVENQSFAEFEKDGEKGLGDKEYFTQYVNVLEFDEQDGTFGNTATHAFYLEKVKEENSCRHACLADAGMIVETCEDYFRVAELSNMLRKYRKENEAKKVLKKAKTGCL